MLYIAFLRGINVGGHQVKMARLVELFSELGLQNVRTYINSGNVFFETAETNQPELVRRIEQHLEKALGFEVPVFLRTTTEMEEILSRNPFKGLEVSNDMRLCLMFLSEPAPKDLELPLYSPKKDMAIIQAQGYEAFLVWYIIDGRPPASDSFLAKTLGKRVTTRFFHTAAKILAAAKKEAKS